MEQKSEIDAKIEEIRQWLAGPMLSPAKKYATFLMSQLQAEQQKNGRCRLTGNLCGTDTLPKGVECLCLECRLDAKEAANKILREALENIATNDPSVVARKHARAALGKEKANDQAR